MCIRWYIRGFEVTYTNMFLNLLCKKVLLKIKSKEKKNLHTTCHSLASSKHNYEIDSVKSINGVSNYF